MSSRSSRRCGTRDVTESQRVAEGGSGAHTLAKPPSIIIACRNQWPLTRRLLESLRANTNLSRCEVIAVDNGSEDETKAELATFTWLRVIRNDANPGFVRGNNAGIAAAAKQNDLLLLNNDVVIEQKDWLERLQECAYAEERNGIVGCRLRLTDGRLLQSRASCSRARTSSATSSMTSAH